MRHEVEAVEPSTAQMVAQNAATRHREDVLRRLTIMEKLLDRQFSVAGFRFGWDSVIGLVPVLGDTVTTGISGWLIWQARQLGAPRRLIARMIANAGVDYVIGLVPLLGDLGDAMFKANTKNVRLLKTFLEGEGQRKSGRDAAPPNRSIPRL